MTTTGIDTAQTPAGEPDERVAKLLTTIGQVDLEVVEDQHFRDQDVYLDGRDFRNCSFVNCRIFVRLGHFQIENLRVLANNAFMMEGPAGTVHSLVRSVQEQQSPSL